MSQLHMVLVALIQGVTEFLPISSSGHLILFPALTGIADQGLLIDVSLHVGTLAAVVVFFWREVRGAIVGAGHVLTGRMRTPQARLALMLALSTVPVVIVGFAMSRLGALDALRSAEVIGWTTLIFGVVLWIADRWGALEREWTGWTWGHALFMGLAQVIALIPGVSRSGITMTAARALGYRRVDAARLSLLMSVPTIAAAGLLAGKDLVESGDAQLGGDAIVSAGLSFVAALAALSVMMRMLRTWSMTPFVIYRLALGAFLLVWVYG